MARKRKGNPVHGWINIDKPSGMTSFQVVAAVRRIMNAQKAGHAGTLDPLGTGILPIALGEATKTIEFAQDHDKTYRFTVTWGARTTTDDSEGDDVEKSDKRPTEDEIKKILPRFTGLIMQTPPNFSAIKVDGQRAYDLAREGEEVVLSPRPQTIYSLVIDAHTGDSTVFLCVCSKGTYMRSLARDMGQMMGCFGHISALRRLKTGNFTENNAISLDALEKIMHSGDASNALLSVETALDDIPALAITEAEASRLRTGQALMMMSKSERVRLDHAGIDFNRDTIILLAHTEEKAVALVLLDGGQLKPVKVFNL